MLCVLSRYIKRIWMNEWEDTAGRHIKVLSITFLLAEILTIKQQLTLVNHIRQGHSVTVKLYRVKCCVGKKRMNKRVVIIIIVESSLSLPWRRGCCVSSMCSLCWRWAISSTRETPGSATPQDSVSAFCRRFDHFPLIAVAHSRFPRNDLATNIT